MLRIMGIFFLLSVSTTFAQSWSYTPHDGDIFLFDASRYHSPGFIYLSLTEDSPPKGHFVVSREGPLPWISDWYVEHYTWPNWIANDSTLTAVNLGKGLERELFPLSYPDTDTLRLYDRGQTAYATDFRQYDTTILNEPDHAMSFNVIRDTTLFSLVVSERFGVVSVRNNTAIWVLDRARVNGAYYNWEVEKFEPIPGCEDFEMQYEVTTTTNQVTTRDLESVTMKDTVVDGKEYFRFVSDAGIYPHWHFNTKVWWRYDADHYYILKEGEDSRAKDHYFHAGSPRGKYVIQNDSPCWVFGEPRQCAKYEFFEPSVHVQVHYAEAIGCTFMKEELGGTTKTTKLLYARTCGKTYGEKAVPVPILANAGRMAIHSIYPNPVRSSRSSIELVLELPTEKQEVVVTVYDILGNCVYNSLVAVSQLKSSISVPLKGIRKGLYTCLVTAGNQTKYINFVVR